MGIVREFDIVQPPGTPDKHSVDFTDVIAGLVYLQIALEIPGDGMPVSILNAGSEFIIDRASSDPLIQVSVVNKISESPGGVNHNVDIKAGTELHIPAENVLGGIVPVVSGGISETVAITGRMTGELDNSAAFIAVVDIAEGGTGGYVIVDIPAGSVAVFGIFVDGTGRRRRLPAAPVETGRKLPGCPGVAEDRVAVGPGGVVGDFNVECRIALVVNEVRYVDCRGAFDFCKRQVGLVFIHIPASLFEQEYDFFTGSQFIVEIAGFCPGVIEGTVQARFDGQMIFVTVGGAGLDIEQTIGLDREMVVVFFPGVAAEVIGASADTGADIRGRTVQGRYDDTGGVAVEIVVIQSTVATVTLGYLQFKRFPIGPSVVVPSAVRQSIMTDRCSSGSRNAAVFSDPPAAVDVSVKMEMGIPVFDLELQDRVPVGTCDGTVSVQVEGQGGADHDDLEEVPGPGGSL